jgi:histidinol-phosphate aminotransferase
MSTTINNLALSRIKAIEPYRPPLDGRTAFFGDLLDFNERTTQWPAATIGDLRLNLYPEYFDLVANIARYVGSSPDSVMITNGTDQAIDVIFRTFSDTGDSVVIPEPTFSMYQQYAHVNGCKIVTPLYMTAPFRYPTSAVVETVKDAKIVVVCNPNNPTGTLVPNVEIRDLASALPNTIIYVDEAYFEFSRHTAVGLIDKYPNIIVSRTFSKAFGLAGLRIGYLIANATHIREMLKVRGPYDVNAPAANAAAQVLALQSEVVAYSTEVMQNAKPLVEKFFANSKISFHASAGNFILFEPVNAQRVAEVLRENGVAVRAQTRPLVQNMLRVTIGTSQQMESFIDTYQSKVIGRDWAGR